MLPSSKRELYELVLTYDVEQDEAGSFVVRAAALQEIIYESAFEGVTILLFDGDKRFLGAVKSFPTPIAVPKGPCVIRVQIRHADPTKLEKMRDLVIWIERSLAKQIKLSVYPSKEALMNGAGVFKRRLLKLGSSAAVFIAEPLSSKVPSSAKCGDFLSGTVTFASGDTSLAGEGKRPGGFDISYRVGPKAKKATPVSASVEPKDDQSLEDEIEDKLRDAKIDFLKKLAKRDKDKFAEIHAKFQAQYPDHIPLKLEKLRFVDDASAVNRDTDQIVDAAEAVISGISEDELALHFGRLSDPNDEKAVAVSLKLLRSVFEAKINNLSHCNAYVPGAGEYEA